MLNSVFCLTCEKNDNARRFDFCSINFFPRFLVRLIPYLTKLICGDSIDPELVCANRLKTLFKSHGSQSLACASPKLKRSLKILDFFLPFLLNIFLTLIVQWKPTSCAQKVFATNFSQEKMEFVLDGSIACFLDYQS